MPKIQQAKGLGKNIKILCDWEGNTEEKIYIFIVSDSGESISKTVQPEKARNVIFSFQDEKERKGFSKVYLANSKKEKITDLCFVEEKQPVFPISLSNKKLWVALIFVCLVFFSISSCRQRGGIQSVVIEQAYWKNFHTISVQGHIAFKENTTQRQKDSILSEFRLQLITNGLPGIEKAIDSNPFVMEIPFSLDTSKKYHIQANLLEIKIENTTKEVVFHPQFSIAAIQGASFNKNRTLEVAIDHVFLGNNLLQLELFQEDVASQTPLLITKISPDKRETRLVLGPVQSYKNRFLLLLKSYGNASRLLDQKKIFYPYAIGKIEHASFSGKSRIMVKGEWDGDSSCILEIVESNPLRLIDQKTPSKSFQETFSIPSLLQEYSARLVSEGEVLCSSPIEKSRAFLEYKTMMESMPLYAKKLDSFLIEVWKGSSALDTQELRSLHLQCDQYESNSQKLLMEHIEKSELLSLQKFYQALKNLGNMGLEARSIFQRKPGKRDLEWIAQKEADLFYLVSTAGKILLEFYPELTDLSAFPRICSFIEQKKGSQRKALLLSYANACAESGQFILGTEVCSQGISEYPDVWQFLMGRYFLYQILEKQNEYSSVGMSFQQKAQEDYKKLIRWLPLEFHKKMLDLDYEQAYIIGSSLLKIKPDMHEIKEKLEKIQREKTSEETLEIRFSYEDWKAQAGK
ncbi:MAG: hypothetical protein HUU50_04555 [Candidatus Brocadiae bacterium]|nr:hypothetical protein [Candidatus Brocadiia bacterium]